MDTVTQTRADAPSANDEASRRVPPPATGSLYEWWVFSTALSEGWLMLYCEKTGKTGSVRDPSRQEWSAAFYAPSNPYRWHDDSRVVVDEENTKDEPRARKDGA